jgi:hypothetical protein
LIEEWPTCRITSYCCNPRSISKATQVSLNPVHFLATNSDVSAMGLELNHLLGGRARGDDLQDLLVVVDHPEHRVVQFHGDDLVDMAGPPGFAE